MMLEWLLKFAVIWISIDAVVMATGWYMTTTIRPLFPNWWRQVVVDEDPEFN